MTRKLFSYALVTLALAANCFGSTITNITITSRFHDPTDDTPGVQFFDPAVSPAGAAAVATVSWGEPPSAILPQSSYRFAAINQPAVPNLAGPINVNPPSVTAYFTLGTFTHNNFVVDNPYLTSVVLDVIMSFSVDGVPSGPQTFSYLIQHTETPNQIETAPPGVAVCPFATPKGAECTDRVVLPGGGAPQTFTIGGVTYSLELAFQTAGGRPVSEFITAETQSNDALLVGRFRATDAPVPEPGTIGSVSAALLALGVLRHRRSRARL